MANNIREQTPSIIKLQAMINQNVQDVSKAAGTRWVYVGNALLADPSNTRPMSFRTCISVYNSAKNNIDQLQNSKCIKWKHMIKKRLFVPTQQPVLVNSFAQK